METVVIDKGLNALAKRLIELQNGHVKVGLPQNGTTNGEDSYSEILYRGAIHEWGAPSRNIPARHWLSSGIDKNIRKIEAAKSKLYQKVLASEITPKQALSTLGVGTVDLVKKNFRTLKPDILEKTKRRKGSSAVLVDSGQLINTISSEVVL